MATPLFPYLVKKVQKDYKRGVFHKYKNGWLLPIIDLKANTPVYESGTFLNSWLIGKFIEYDSEVVGYFFTSHHRTIVNQSYLLAYNGIKAGLVKNCNRVYSEENLVILEYPNSGTMAISPLVDSSILTILEEQ